MRSNVGYYDLEGRFLYATPSLAAYVGMTPQELIGRTWYDIGVPPEVVESLEQARRRVLESGENASRILSVQISGRARQTEFLIKPVKSADGSVVGTVVTAWDVREPKHAYRGRARLDRTYSILSAIDQVILRTRDVNVVLNEACRIVAEIGGFELAWVGLLDAPDKDVRLVCQYGRDEGLLPEQSISARDDPTGQGVVGTSIRENRTMIVQDIARNPRMAAWRSFFETTGYQTAAGFPIRLSGKPIGTLAMYSSKTGHFDAAEARLFEELTSNISSALTSIETERAKAAAQAALATSEKRYRDLFNINPHPMAVYDVETLCFLDVNQAAINAYGYSRDEFLGMTILQTQPTEDLPALIEAIESVPPDGGYHPTGPWRQIRKDGSRFEAEVSTHELAYDDRPARLVLAIDVTERRRLQAKLAEAARLEAMGHLAGGIAHDFNNLLTAVNGYADLLISELEGDERVESAREIRRAGARATDLTRQVLAFSRKQELAPRPVDLNEVVKSVGQMLRRLIGEQVRLALTLSDEPAVVVADPGQIDQVLVNLAVNSRDAMPGGGVLEIEVRVVEDASVLGRGIFGPWVQLTVSDTGSGMDQATLAQAFEPFFTTKEPGLGTGLGLATAHGIVHQSGGQIWAESTPGSGTRIVVLLPAVDARPEPVGTQPPAVRAVVSGAAVLVVEDDSAVRAFAVSTLERAGYRVIVATSPAQAVVLSDGLHEPIEVLLTDVVMPGGNGRDLAARLLASRPDLRVILMSGYDSPPPDGYPDDDHRFLPKPFGADELTLAVSEVLAQPWR